MDNVEKRSRNKNSNILWIIGILLLSKGAVILKALKAFKYAKFVITAITMSISALLYGFAFGSWYFAGGLVLLLLVHEYGHVIAMWKKGVHASAPVFIPFLGALIFAKIPENKADEAYIGYGGPLIGTLGAFAVIAIALMLPEGSFWSTLLHILGNVGLFINLFNLIPARPLDGGRILHPLGASVVYCGFSLLLVLAYVMDDMFFVFIALFSTDNMPIRAWVRRVLWGFLWIAFSFYFFVSEPHGLALGALILVLIVSVIFTFVFAWKARNGHLPEVKSDGETVPRLVKVKWLALYVALLTAIGGTMMWHSQHLPKEVHESSLMKFVHEF